MVNIRQIAQVAGVSIGTVSQALRGNPCVKQETRERVQALAKQMHYCPPSKQQQRREGCIRTLSLILPDVSNHYYSRLLRGVLHAAYPAQWQVLIFEVSADQSALDACLARCIEQRVSGIVIKKVREHRMLPDTMQRLRENGIPLVGIDMHADQHIDQAQTDLDRIARLSVDYLMELGHRSIAFIGHDIHRHINGRATAMRDAFHRHGLSTNLFVECTDQYFGRETAMTVLLRLLANPYPPTAIIGADDTIAVRLIQQAPYCRIAIPKDLSIIGSGNMITADTVTPPLTTIEQNPEDIGHAAVQLLSQLVAADHTETDVPTIVRVPVHLVQRESCGLPRRTPIPSESLKRPPRHWRRPVTISDPKDIQVRSVSLR